MLFLYHNALKSVLVCRSDLQISWVHLATSVSPPGEAVLFFARRDKVAVFMFNVLVSAGVIC